MDYLEFDFTVEPRDPWSDLIMADLGDLGFETFEDTTNGFKAYIPAATGETLDLTKEELANNPAYTVSWSQQSIKGQNWNAIWEENFEPITVGDQCRVRATFHPASSHYPFEIIIDPKMSFGTGHHATTTLMLAALLDREVTQQSVLDMGSGTGVLAILAALKGATTVVGIDNDEWAYANAVENAGRNGTHQIEFLLGDAALLGSPTYDLILANINKNIVLNDLAAYAQALNPGGRLLLSGFFPADVADIRKRAESSTLEYVSEAALNGWARVEFLKN